jgi:hypothetical protein
MPWMGPDSISLRDRVRRGGALFLLAFFAEVLFLLTFLPDVFFLLSFFLLGFFLLGFFLPGFFLLTFLLAAFRAGAFFLLAAFLRLVAFFLLAAFFLLVAFLEAVFFLLAFLVDDFRLLAFRDAAFLRDADAFFRFLLAALFAAIRYSCGHEKRAGLYIAGARMEAHFSTGISAFGKAPDRCFGRQAGADCLPLATIVLLAKLLYTTPI